AALFLLLLAGGFAGVARWCQHDAHHYERNLAEVDRALEHAWVVDKGWDRSGLEAAVREALASEKPNWSYSELVFVLVDDRFGVSEDRAHFVASGDGGESRVVLARRESDWVLDRVE